MREAWVGSQCSNSVKGIATIVRVDEHAREAAIPLQPEMQFT